MTLQSIGGHLTIGLGGILFLGAPVALWGGAYGYAIAAKAGISLGTSFAIGVALAACAGAIFAFFYARMSNDSFAVITLASVLAVDALIRSWDSVTGGVLGIAGVPRFGFGQTLKNLAIFEMYIAGLALGLEAIFIHSSWGRSLRALKENKIALISMGTSAKFIGQMVLLFASIFIGLSGVFAISRVQFLDPTFGGMVLLVQILTIAIISSAPKTLRLFAVTVIIVLLPEFLRFLNLPVSILGYLRSLIYSLLLIILIFYTLGNTYIKRYV
ncbi:MAG: branched-chain amino acid ABC transporter permease [Candidatus Sungbacteria bacterium]|nr:branched-chain amino acid ABC transporter permease [Candidatus Sungbacteria bacterium]